MPLRWVPEGTPGIHPEPLPCGAYDPPVRVLPGSPDPFDDLLRPRRLQPGGAVAVVSPSWGGPAAFPHIVEAAVVGVVGGEIGRGDLPIVANVSFGHTDPQWVLPLGVRAAADLDAGTLTLVEPWLA